MENSEFFLSQDRIFLLFFLFLITELGNQFRLSEKQEKTFIKEPNGSIRVQLLWSHWNNFSYRARIKVFNFKFSCATMHLFEKFKFQFEE